MIFTFIHNKYFKRFMGLIDKINKNEAALKAASNNSNKEEDLLLNKEELKYLLSLIKNSSFSGKDIEIIYNLTWKLQKAVLSLDKD
tara:strand:- start:1043 stop:1300 length:258 start_codon:yes stop_codon:yes gene_type:complete